MRGSIINSKHRKHSDSRQGCLILKQWHRLVRLTLSGSAPKQWGKRQESNKAILGEHGRQFYFTQFIQMTKQKGPSILVRIKRADTPKEPERKNIAASYLRKSQNKKYTWNMGGGGSGMSHRNLRPWDAVLEGRNGSQLQTPVCSQHTGTWTMERGCLFVVQTRSHITKDAIKFPRKPRTNLNFWSYVPSTRVICMQPSWLQGELGIERRASHMLGEHSSNWATSLASWQWRRSFASFKKQMDQLERWLSC